MSCSVLVQSDVIRRPRTETVCSNAECCSCVTECSRVSQGAAVCCSVLQCMTVCCSVLQCVAVCCSVLRCCSVWQCVAICCSVLRCVAACGAGTKQYTQASAVTCITLPLRLCVEVRFGLCLRAYKKHMLTLCRWVWVWVWVWVSIWVYAWGCHKARSCESMYATQYDT